MLKNRILTFALARQKVELHAIALSKPQTLSPHPESTVSTFASYSVA